MHDSSNAGVDYDVVIIGAGISGINAAYRVQTEAPAGTTYVIYESRADIGGTWSFFKYPGLRSDSDLQTFGFEWRPWGEHRTIVDGPSILKYLNRCVEEKGIAKHIRTNHRLNAADWSSSTMSWKLTINSHGQERTVRSRFLIFGSGYYNYEEPLATSPVPGIERFKGPVVHPQFWPEDLDYKNKKMVIIGSGATAITLLPAVAQKAAHVTMVQRSPTYIVSLPSKDPLGKLLHSILPSSWAFKLNRLRFILMSYVFFHFCRSFPNAARKLLAVGTKQQLPEAVPFSPHFQPTYNPWEQRLCVTPDGEFFKTLQTGKADIVTGNIRTVTEKGLLMESGETVTTDIICTATGLQLRLGGGAKISVDGKPFDTAGKWVWKGVMFQDLPNAFFLVGYTNASYTLAADAAVLVATRLMNMMNKNNQLAAVPRMLDQGTMKGTPMLNLNSTYIKHATSILPLAGDRGQWKPRSNYFIDLWQATRGDVTTNLEFYGQPLANGDSKL